MKLRIADVVIVGAGIVGLAIADELWRRGIRNIQIIDRGRIASGSTAIAAGFIRRWHKDIIWNALADESWDQFDDWREQLGKQLVRDVVFSVLGSGKGDVTAHEPYKFGSDEAAVSIPARRADAKKLAAALASSLAQRGIRISEGIAARSLLISDNRVIGLVTSSGSIGCRNCIVATGGDVRLVAPLRELPVRRTPVSAITFAGCATPDASALIDLTHPDGFYLTPDGANWLATVGPPRYQTAHEPTSRPDITQFLQSAVQRRLGLADLPLAGTTRHGTYDVTPDGRPIVGQIPGIDGCLVATGLSGSGYQIAPAIARRIVDLVLENESARPDAENRAISPARFSA